MGLRTLLIPKGQKGVEAEETRLAQVGGRREEKNSRQLNEILFGVWNALCELSIYRENSQLISEKLWEQVIHYFVIK